MITAKQNDHKPIPSQKNDIDEIGNIVLEQILEFRDPGGRKMSKDQNIKDFGLDSLDHIELMMFIERRFNIYVSEDGFAKFTTVNNIAKYISNEIKNQTF